MSVSHIFGSTEPRYRSVTASAHGKVNLHLGVGPAREDGYHELDTIFQAVSLKEEVTVALKEGAPELCTWTVSGFDSHLVPQDFSNLAWKAVAEIQKLARHAHVPWAEVPVHIHIDKGIPVAGGMAGGSADAAAALIAATELYFPDPRSPRRPDSARLSEIAADLGADVPFCLLGGTARGTGKGENLMPVIATGTYHWAIATDKRGLSTPEVFKQLDQQRTTASTDSPRAARAGSPDALIAACGPETRPRLANFSSTTYKPQPSACCPACGKRSRPPTKLAPLPRLCLAPVPPWPCCVRPLTMRWM